MDADAVVACAGCGEPFVAPEPAWIARDGVLAAVAPLRLEECDRDAMLWHRSCFVSQEIV